MGLEVDSVAKLLRLPPTFFRFLLVGAAGFLVEAAILSYLCNIRGFGPYTGRAVSFSVAVVTTWLLNRTFTFKVRAYRRPHAEFLRYLVVSALGLATNLGVYGVAVSIVYWMRRYPALALVPASLAGMAINYMGARYFAFGIKTRGV